MKLLIPLDGSRLADAVVSHVVALIQRDRSACEVHLLHGVAAGVAAQDEAGAHLKALDELLSGLQFRVRRFVVCTAQPVEAILEHVARERIDLVAMATHGRSGISRLLYGSVAERVVRGCSASLLLVNPHGLALTGEGLRYERILLPLDGGTLVEDALPPVTALARAAGASVILLALGDAARPLAEQARRALEGAGVTTASSTTLDVPSDPARSVLAASHGRGARLIVLGSRPGSSSASPWPIGQAEGQLVREAPCAVLLLRAPGLQLDAPPPAAPARADER